MKYQKLLKTLQIFAEKDFGPLEELYFHALFTLCKNIESNLLKIPQDILCQIPLGDNRHLILVYLQEKIPYPLAIVHNNGKFYLQADAAWFAKDMVRFQNEREATHKILEKSNANLSMEQLEKYTDLTAIKDYRYHLATDYSFKQERLYQQIPKQKLENLFHAYWQCQKENQLENLTQDIPDIEL